VKDGNKSATREGAKEAEAPPLAKLRKMKKCQMVLIFFASQ